MYAERELADLAQRKSLVQARIAVRRLQCRLDAAQLAVPLGTVDKAVAFWRQLSPLVKTVGIPVALLGLRRFFGGGTKSGAVPKSRLAALLSALPIILRLIRTWREVSATRPRAS